VPVHASTVRSVNIKKNLNNRLAKIAQMAILKLQQPNVVSASQAPIKTKSLFAKTAPLATINRLQDR